MENNNTIEEAKLLQAIETNDKLDQLTTITEAAIKKQTDVMSELEGQHWKDGICRS